MRFLHPLAFALLALAIVIVILSILRARQRRREVAALALWDGLMESAPTAMTTLRYFLDLQLLLQLACLLLLTVALAEPIWHGQRTSSGAIALVLDTSASMLALTPEGETRYAAAIRRAEALLDAAPSSPVAILSLSESPQMLAAPTLDRRALRAALSNSTATYLADGTSAQLGSLLDSVGGAGSYERVVFLTDRGLPDVPFPVTYEILPSGDNLAITAFAVRENPSGGGVSAFLEVLNAGHSVVADRVAVRDESARTSLDVYLEPSETAQFVIPFPLSRGTRFVATLDRQDACLHDNVRYASLARSLELRVRWLGEDNRFLAAALEAALPITRVGAGEPADLTVAYDVQLDELPLGNVLLVHAAVRGVISYGPPGLGGTSRREVGDDALLAGIEAGDLFVERIDSLFIERPHAVLLSAGGSPLVATLSVDDCRILVLNSDLYGTNLPITVDFPLLIRNFLDSVARLPSQGEIRWNLVGQPIDLSAYGDVTSIATPAGVSLAIAEGRTLFAPDEPGSYELSVGAERYPLSVNVAADQSQQTQGPPTESPAHAASGLLRSDVFSALWPYAAAIALAVLIVETLVAFDTLSVWRKRRPS